VVDSVHVRGVSANKTCRSPSDMVTTSGTGTSAPITAAISGNDRITELCMGPIVPDDPTCTEDTMTTLGLKMRESEQARGTR